MKEIDKNAYQEKRNDKGQLMIFGIVIAVIALAGLIGGIALFVNGFIVGGVWAKIWRIILGAVLALFGGTLGVVSFMMISTASSMINVKNGDVSDVGNSAMGTVNINKCSKCGQKLDDDATHCTKCGTQIDGVVKCECGAINSIENEYCKSCGKKLN